MESHFNFYHSLKLICVFCLFLFASKGYSQDEFLYTDFAVDHLGNLYTLFEGDELTKLVESEELEILDYNYSNRALGEITNFDVSNPLKIIVNHESFSTLVFLDVTLRETAQIYLPDLQIFSNPLAYCMANDNTVWIYDDTNIELVRINEEGERMFTSQNLIQQLGFTPQITNLRANKSYLVAKDREKGFLIFDSFGTYLKYIPIEADTNFQLLENSILIQEEEKVIEIPIEGIGRKEVADLPEGVTHFHIQNQVLYFLTEFGVGEMTLGE